MARGQKGVYINHFDAKGFLNMSGRTDLGVPKEQIKSKPAGKIPVKREFIKAK